MIGIVRELPGPSAKAQLEGALKLLAQELDELAMILSGPAALNSGEVWLVFQSLLIITKQAKSALELTRRLP